MGKRDITFATVIAVLAVLLTRYLGSPQTAVHAEPADSESTQTPENFTKPAASIAIEREFAAAWRNRDLQPTPLADPLIVARRISLAMTGTIPSLEEIRQFEDELQSKSRSAAISQWIDRILDDRRYADYQAERLARVLVGVKQEPFLVYRRNRFVSWLSDQLLENVPYDSLVRSLITATGLWTDSPAVNFLTVTIGGAAGDRPDEVPLASRASRAFLGVRLDCMQCHDDNLGGDWLQTDFHELAAFFAEASPSFVGILDKPRDYNYKYLDAKQEVTVEPQVPFAADLATSTGSRREQLAGWVTHPENRAFSRTVVNRIWALAFGAPMIEPIDSIPLEGPYPPGMETIVDDFIEHHFDLRRLWHVIMSSDVFQRDSRAPFEITAKHERLFAAYPLTRLRPEQAAGALLQSARLTTVDADSHVLLRIARRLQTGEFVNQYGDTGEDEFEAHGGTIPQRLLMLNGKLVRERTQDDLVANAAPRIAVLSASPEQAVEALFLTILTRQPSPEETEHFTALRENYSNRPVAWAEHVAWTLINSTEFSWNH